MCSLIPVGGRDLGCLVGPGMSSGRLGMELVILRAVDMFPVSCEVSLVVERYLWLWLLQSRPPNGKICRLKFVKHMITTKRI